MLEVAGICYGAKAEPMSRFRHTFTLRVRVPFELRTVALSHGWYEVPPFAWDAGTGTLSVAVAGPRGGARRLDIRQGREKIPRTRQLRLTWTGHGRSRPDVLEREGARLARRVLNLDLDLTHFFRLCRSRGPLRWVPRAGGGRILRGPSLFSDVISGICGTNIQWKQAVGMIHRLCEVAPTPPGSRIPRYPGPGEILAAGEPHLRGHARLGYRADSVLRFCRAVLDGTLDLGPAERGELGADGMRAFLRSLPGIGPVTARYLATLYGHFDELAVDSLVLNYIGDKYFGGRRPREPEVQALYAPFGRWRALAYWFEFLGDVDPFTWRGWGRSAGSSNPVLSRRGAT